MKLSTKGRYASRALLDLALHSGHGPILVKDIARREGISKQYLEHLVLPLKAAGIIKSVRGAHGGLTLAKRPAEIKLSEVIQTLEGSLAPVECVDDPRLCKRSRFCVTRDVWIEIKMAVVQILESTTLEDLVERQKAKAQSEELMYNI